MCGGQGDSQPTVGRIKTTAAAALGFPIPAYPMQKDTTIYTVTGEDLDMSSWDRILCGGHGDHHNFCSNKISGNVVIAMLAVVIDIV